jgi:hypothetical protein
MTAGELPPSTVAGSMSGSSCREEALFTNVFSRDFADTVEAFEGDRLIEPVSLSLRPSDASAEGFLDCGLQPLAGTAAASLEAFRALVLLVTFTDDVVLTTFCSLDSFLVFPVLAARLAEEAVLKSWGSLLLVLRLAGAAPGSTDFFLVGFFSGSTG